MRKRYCQRCTSEQVLTDTEEPRPCRYCGGIHFNAQPLLHSKYGYELTSADRDFLRCNGIDPED